MNKLPMTAAGHLALENELTHRIRAERPRLIQRIQETIADDTNLAENSDYQAVKTEQELNEARIGELEDKLARAEIINVAKLSGDTTPPGASTSIVSPLLLPINARAIGEATEIFPLWASASGSPAICHVFFSPVSSSISLDLDSTVWSIDIGPMGGDTRNA